MLASSTLRKGKTLKTISTFNILLLLITLQLFIEQKWNSSTVASYETPLKNIFDSLTYTDNETLAEKIFHIQVGKAHFCIHLCECGFNSPGSSPQRRSSAQ